MKRISGLQILNVLAYIATVAANFLSQRASVLGVDLFPATVGDLAESRAVFFLPAGYVFAIWGVIYLGLAAYVIYQARPSQRDTPLMDAIGYWFVLSCAANVGWLVLFLNDLIWASTIAILTLALSLAMIYVGLDIGRTQVSRIEAWAVHIPFSIYLGWVTVATVANVAAALYDSGYVTAFLGLGADVWTVIMMAVATMLALIALFRRNDIAFALVVVWALVGIYARPFDTPVFAELSSQDAAMVDMSALLLAAVIAGVVVVHVALRRRQSPRAAASI